MEEINSAKLDLKTGIKAKGNSNRTPSQIEAFERARDKKREIAKIKKDNTDAIRIEKEIDLQAKKLQTIEIQKRINMYKSEDEEAEEEEVVIVPKKKALAKVSLPIPVAKPKKKKIIYQEEESEESEEEIIIVRPKKSKAKPKKKKIIYQDEESEEEEEPKNLPQHIQKNAQEQMKYDLHTERINSALRSLGYIG
jgi:hypothetical protein